MRPGRKRKERRRAIKAEAAKAAMSPESTQIAESRGLGAVVVEHGNETLIKNQRMEARAILEEWPIKEQYREPLINGQVMIALDPKMEPRNRTRAFMALLAANKQNIEAKNPKAGTGTQVNVSVGVQVIGDPALQQKAEQYGLTQSRLAGMIETNGHQNGHTNGNGHANGFHPNGSNAHD